MKVAVIGTGYVGLVTGACLSETGIQVACIDVDKNKIERLKQGIIPIYEPGLDRLVKNNYEKDRLQFSISLPEGIKDAEAIFIAVGTPPGEDGSADLSYVIAVAKEIGQNLTKYAVVVTKSTVPIGTSHKVKAAVQEELDARNSDIKFDVASNPEFLKEGNAVEDFLRPDRIVLGVESEQAIKILNRVYHPFMLSGHRIITMDIPSAEMTKYAANAMLATKISFMNDIANLCEIVGADVSMVRKGIAADARIGNKFIYPGVGFGGSCFPKDVKALIKTASEYNYSLDVLKAVESVNNRQKFVIVDKIKSYFKDDIKGKKIAIWGLAFKPNTDDTREAPAFVIIDELLKLGAQVAAYDPAAIEETKKVFGDKILYGKESYDVLVDADALVLVTEWSEFRVLNYPVLSKLMNGRVIFDGRNIYSPQEVIEHGFDYFNIGSQPLNHL
ncbi:UDP-glucose dehydrogenase family protein [Saccharicrinis sp. FJH2]|uniref:UDP-glucose dehydrogenase family protein n=1 Tax=Saccharicrinis sp. FJH65 TaxID=3344659 RepID=UPI0035F24330